MSNLSNRTLEDKVKGEFRYRCKAADKRCAYCNQKINYAAPRNHPESFEAAHIYPVKTHPHRAYDPSNFAPSHSKCNRSAGAEKMVLAPKWTEANWG